VGIRTLFRREEVIAPQARLDALRYVVFDTEFTSLDQRKNRLLSIGAVAMDGGRIRVGEQFYRVTNPQVAVPGESVVVHRLRAEDIAEAESPQKVLDEFTKFAEGAVLVGHFVHYDVEIVAKEFGAEWKPPSIDTARVHRWLECKRQRFSIEAFDERTIKTDLASVAQNYGVQFEEAHHALADAFVTAQVWQKELAALTAIGVRTWRELRPASR
jgi:DNA polymerase-3 subunit epsilon